IGLGELTSLSLTLLRWPVLLVAAGLSLSLIYRFGSNQENARWHWITMGSATASLLWVCSSILFEWVISKFGGFDVVYGSLSALIGYMIWIWLSAIVVLFGAESATLRRGNKTA
ncbi:MAG: YihY/virulence factor BrkB family protein, partial [Methylocella sp.]